MAFAYSARGVDCKIWACLMPRATYPEARWEITNAHGEVDDGGLNSPSRLVMRRAKFARCARPTSNIRCARVLQWLVFFAFQRRCKHSRQSVPFNGNPMCRSALARVVSTGTLRQCIAHCTTRSKWSGAWMSRRLAVSSTMRAACRSPRALGFGLTLRRQA